MIYQLTPCPDCGQHPHPYFHVNGWNIRCHCRNIMTPCKNLADAAWYWERSIPKKYRKKNHECH